MIDIFAIPNGGLFYTNKANCPLQIYDQSQNEKSKVAYTDKQKEYFATKGKK